MTSLFDYVHPATFIIVEAIAIIFLLGIRRIISANQKKSIDLFIAAFLLSIIVRLFYVTYFTSGLIEALYAGDYAFLISIHVALSAIYVIRDALFYTLLAAGLLRFIYTEVKINFNILIAAIILIISMIVPWMWFRPPTGDSAFYIYPDMDFWNFSWGEFPWWMFTTSVMLQASTYIAFILSVSDRIPKKIKLAMAGLSTIFSVCSALTFVLPQFTSGYPARIFSLTPAPILPLISAGLIFFTSFRNVPPIIKTKKEYETIPTTEKPEEEKATIKTNSKQHLTKVKKECGNCRYYLKEECPRAYSADEEIWKKQKACDLFQPMTTDVNI